MATTEFEQLAVLSEGKGPTGPTPPSSAKKRWLKKAPKDLFLSGMVWGAAIVTFTTLIYIIAHVLINGIPHLTLDFFSLQYNSDNVSVVPAVITTVLMTLLALSIAVPLGVFTAIYLVEYASRSNRLVGLIRVTTETLAGIPSIVYGLFGLLFFVSFLGWGLSLMAGAFTLTIMILPLLIRTTEEALKSVPDSFREGSYGLGAGRLRTIFRIILPSAMPGLLAGIILAIGRIVGESAALIYTAGTVAHIPEGLFSSGRTLAIHMYALANEGLHVGKAYATATVLLVVVVGINTMSNLIAKRFTKG